MEKLCQERAVQLLESACEVTRAREEKVAAEERLQGITLVNKDLLTQVSVVHQQWQASSAELMAEISDLRTKLQTSKDEADMAKQQHLAALEDVRKEVKAAHAAQALAEEALVQQRAVVLKEISEHEVVARFKSTQAEESAAKAERLLHRLAETFSENNDLKAVYEYINLSIHIFIYVSLLFLILILIYFLACIHASS